MEVPLESFVQSLQHVEDQGVTLKQAARKARVWRVCATNACLDSAQTARREGNHFGSGPCGELPLSVLSEPCIVLQTFAWFFDRLMTEFLQSLHNCSEVATQACNVSAVLRAFLIALKVTSLLTVILSPLHVST